MKRPTCHRCGKPVVHAFEYEYVGGEPFHPGCADQVRSLDAKRNFRLKVQREKSGAFREILEMMSQCGDALLKKEGYHEM